MRLLPAGPRLLRHLSNNTLLTIARNDTSRLDLFLRQNSDHLAMDGAIGGKEMFGID